MKEKQQIESMLRTLAKLRDPDAIATYCFRKPNGDFWVHGKIHKEWYRLVLNPKLFIENRERVDDIPEPDDILHPDNRKIFIAAPRDHRKTVKMSIILPLIILGLNPNMLIKIVSNSDDKAADILSAIKQNIETNKYLHEIFPHLKPGYKWSANQIIVQRDLIARDPSVEARGVLSSVTGGRANIIIYDDICDYRTSIYQPAMRPVIKETFYQVWENLLEAGEGEESGGTSVYICTFWHREDLNSELAQHPEWIKWIKPAIYNGEPILPEVWSLEKLERKKRDDPDSFQVQFMLELISDKERMFPELEIRYGASGEEIAKDFRKFVGIDLAASLSKSASYTSIFVLGVDTEETYMRVPVKIIRERMPFPRLIDTIHQVYDKYQPDLIMVETNAFQKAVQQALSYSKVRMPIVGESTGSDKRDREIGIPSIATEMKLGMWEVWMKEKHKENCSCPFCAWLKELSTYPNSEHTDTIMAMWLAVKAFRRLWGDPTSRPKVE